MRQHVFNDKTKTVTSFTFFELRITLLKRYLQSKK